MRDVKGYEGIYAVTEQGEVWSHLSHKFLKSADNGTGYRYVHLRRDGKGRNCLVHRLVAEAFVENPLRLAEVNHKDENKQNNNKDNLEWCSHSYNNRYGSKRERGAKTWRNNGKTYRKVICIETNAIYRSISEAANALNLFAGDISRSCRNIKGHQTCGGYHWKYAEDAI